MKRPTPEMRRRQMRASIRELDKTINRFGYGEWYGDCVRSQNEGTYRAVSYSTPLVRIRLRGSLNLATDPDNALAQMNQLLQVQERNARIRVSLDDVTSLDAAGLLYLSACHKRLVDTSAARIDGSYPKDEHVKQLLLDGDFHRFMTGKSTRKRPDKPQLELLHGVGSRFVDKSKIATQFQDFLSKRNPQLTVPEIDVIYLAVMECLDNVGGHAYPDADVSRPKDWYVVGLFDEKTGMTSVAILDIGVGIIKTVSAQMSKLRLAFKPDADLLEEATKGLRNETAEAKHGKGLRSLMEFSQAGEGRHFHVLSSSRMITWQYAAKPKKQKLPSFLGTIVSLEITNTARPSAAP